MKNKDNFYYLCYVLGYDLLHSELINGYFNECDTTFEACKEIIIKFLKSEENKNTNKSQYDALVEFIENNIKYIDETLSKHLDTIPQF